MKVFIVIVSALLTTAFADFSSACGDSLYRVGQGISYREYSAPLPGNVLIYANSPSAGNLAAALSRSGHHVRVVENELALSVELKTSRYDVIIAAYNEHAAVESRTTESTTRYLPVALSKAQFDAAEARYAKVMVADRDEVKHYLKAIHRILEGRLS